MAHQGSCHCGNVRFTPPAGGSAPGKHRLDQPAIDLDVLTIHALDGAGS